MKKLIENIIKFYDLKGWEHDIRRREEVVYRENVNLERIIHDLSRLNKDADSKANAMIDADVIYAKVEERMRMAKMFSDFDKLKSK